MVTLGRYHCNYDCLHLNDKVATLFTKVEWPQSIKENSSIKLFSDCEGTSAKGDTFTSVKSKRNKRETFWETKIWDRICLRNIQNSKDLMKYYNVEWPDLGTLN